MGRHPGASGVQGWLAPGGQHPSDGWDPAPGTLSGSTHLFCSQMISGLGLPSAPAPSTPLTAGTRCPAPCPVALTCSAAR